LRDSFTALKKSLAEITAKNMYDPIEGPYAGPNTRLGLAIVSAWHVADSLRPDDHLSPRERYSAAGKSAQSAEAEREILNHVGNLPGKWGEKFAVRTR